MKDISLTRNQAEWLVELLEASDPKKDGSWRMDMASEVRQAFGMITRQQELDNIMSTMGIVSSGNREQDEAHLLRAAESEIRIRTGYCPNKCGIHLTKLEEGEYECKCCKFHLHSRSL